MCCVMFAATHACMLTSQIFGTVTIAAWIALLLMHLINLFAIACNMRRPWPQKSFGHDINIPWMIRAALQ